MADFEITLKFSLNNKVESYVTDMDKALNCSVPLRAGGGRGFKCTANSRNVRNFGNENFEASRSERYFLDLRS